LQKKRAGLGPGYSIKIFGLNIKRELLYKKIDQRVDKMFRQGLVREVSRLLKSKLSLTAKYAIGINELKGYLAGAYPLAEAKRLIQRNSRHYAKRQLTWFRKDKRIQWVKLTQKDSPAQIAIKLWKKLS
jgi:tRNA dimethylallyltransferase